MPRSLERRPVSTMQQMSWLRPFGLAWLGLVLTLVGCVRIPFLRRRREAPLPPEAVQRFANQTQALTRAPGTPTLPQVTRSMSSAIEALPEVAGGGQLAEEVRQQAAAMEQHQTDAP